MLVPALFLFAAAPAPVVVVTTTPATGVSLQVTGKCGPNSMTVENYGASDAGPPKILINDVEANGTDLPQLVAYLAHPKAVYHIWISCLSAEKISLYVLRAERTSPGVDYSSGGGIFDGAKFWGFKSYRSTEENFLK